MFRRALWVIPIVLAGCTVWDLHPRNPVRARDEVLQAEVTRLVGLAADVPVKVRIRTLREARLVGAWVTRATEPVCGGGVRARGVHLPGLAAPVRFSAVDLLGNDEVQLSFPARELERRRLARAQDATLDVAVATDPPPLPTRCLRLNVGPLLPELRPPGTVPLLIGMRFTFPFAPLRDMGFGGFGVVRMGLSSSRWSAGLDLGFGASILASEGPTSDNMFFQIAAGATIGRVLVEIGRLRWSAEAGYDFIPTFLEYRGLTGDTRLVHGPRLGTELILVALRRIRDARTMEMNLAIEALAGWWFAGGELPGVPWMGGGLGMQLRL